jgi:hypothetical protein
MKHHSTRFNYLVGLLKTQSSYNARNKNGQSCTEVSQCHDCIYAVEQIQIQDDSKDTWHYIWGNSQLHSN